MLAVVGLAVLVLLWGGAALAEGEAPQGADATSPAAEEAPPEPAPVDNAEAALERAGEESKHLFVLAWSEDDETTGKVKALFAESGEPMAEKALFHEANVGNTDEAGFVEKYGLKDAPLPIVLVFAPNGAVVGAHVQKAIDQDALAASFASPKLAEVFKLLQDGKLVLLCVQSESTEYNDQSLSAAKGASEDERAKDGIAFTLLDPTDNESSDLTNRIGVPTTLDEAAIYIIVPPGTIAGRVKGETTAAAVWDALVRAVSACSSGGCGTGGCASGACPPAP